ncbi:uncharacterized protein LOC127243729 isoform X2 [Andrographis paniculata]|nr:uncharacterized protein LOC127243729 isoform X2 [Andrographis paniculata]XP_051119849.1 uncharacterized protein LOC127243729 isoform X2 [Andrographis paniculata]
MEESAMTIEFLRARLLSERSVSKSARQRADELAKRVAELELELQFVSVQRKKAEKATADVLAILENRGISDVSEEYDSDSEKDENSHNFNPSNGSLSMKETSDNVKPRSNEGEAYSSSEIESSPSTGRSLAWKSTKDSQHTLEKKKYMESVRRRASFSSITSTRRVGKSCRRIRRRETRSMEEIQNDGDGETVASREGSGYDNEKDHLDSGTKGLHSESQKINGHYYSAHERDEDMESALQRQARLIDQYEEEEKAQREWEEKFRENNNCTQESYDPGNHSDVTEERYEMEAPIVSRAAETLSLVKQETNHESADARFIEGPQMPMNSLISVDTDSGNLKEEKSNGLIESSASEFSFPTTKDKQQPEASELRLQHHLPASIMAMHPSGDLSSQFHKAIPGISSSLDLAVIPKDTSNNLSSVLEALHLAKQSLNEKIHGVAPMPAESSRKTLPVDTFKVPIFPPGLFRLPSDAHPGSSHANFLPEIAPSRYLSEPLGGSRIPFSSGSLFHTAPNRSSTTEISTGSPPQRSLSQPRLGEGASSPFGRLNHLDPHMAAAHPAVADTYLYHRPDITYGLISNEGGPKSFPSSEAGLPPISPVSSYIDQFRPNMNFR